MKYIIVFFFLFPGVSVPFYGQVGIGTNNPNTNAALEVTSINNKGLLIPRGDAATRGALNTNTAKGLMLYDTVTNSIWIHDGSGFASGWHNQQPVAGRSIIPYAASNAILTTDPTGGPGNILIMGFPYIAQMPFSNSLSGFAYQHNAFVLPRDGTIKSVALYFNFNNTYNLTDQPVITARLFITDATNTFTPLAGAQTSITFPVNVTPGTFASSVSNISVPVTALNRLMMTISVSGPGSSSFLCNVNASIAIE